MPNYRFINELLTAVWQIQPQFAAAMLPYYRGVLNGMQFDDQAEPEESKPRLVALSADSEGGTSRDGHVRKISIVHLSGTMMKNDGACGAVGTRTVAARLAEADADEDVIGQVLVIDSGGGTVDSGRQLTADIAKLKKPVVAFVDGNACSAAYRAAAACESIVCNDGYSSVGCIGTYCEIKGMPSRANLAGGEVYARVNADGADEKNLEWEKALGGDFHLLKANLLNPMNDEFTGYISSHRPSVLPEQLRGRQYYAKDVVGSLVDSIGDLQSALDRVAALSEANSQNSKQNDMTEQTQTLAASVQTSADASAVEAVQSATVTGELHTEAADAVRDMTERLNAAGEQIRTLTDQLAASAARVAELEAALSTDNDPSATEHIQAPKASDGGVSAVETDPEKMRTEINDILKLIR